jgi:hypothetical protein
MNCLGLISPGEQGDTRRIFIRIMGKEDTFPQDYNRQLSGGIAVKESDVCRSQEFYVPNALYKFTHLTDENQK